MPRLDPLCALVLVMALAGVAAAEEAERFPLGPTVPTGRKGDARFVLTPPTTTLLLRQDLGPGALTLHDLLAAIPGLSLLRDAPGLVGDPATRGLSLRGVGPGGTSRALVLVDGVPLNDAFGGWVEWARVPPPSVEEVEVVRGAPLTVWATAGPSGLVHVVTRPPAAPTVAVDAGYGDHDTGTLHVHGGGRRGALGVVVDGRLLDTGGFAVVRADQRGAIDVDADARQGVLRGRLEIASGEDASAYLATRYAAAEYGLGTPLQRTESRGGGATAGLRLGVVERGQWDYTLFGERQTYETAVASAGADRATEQVALRQEIPADSLGGAAQWTRRFLRASGAPGPHLFTLGVDARWVDGESRETHVDGAGLPRRRRAGGRQLQAAFFGQDVDTIFPWLEVIMGARLEYWRSDDGVVEVEGDAAGDRRRVEPRTAMSFSHRSGARVQALPGLTFRIVGGEAFRPPTLAEQYATRRVRDDVTLATPGLRPERVDTGEVGLECEAPAGFQVRAAGFWTDTTDAVTEVTLPPGAAPGECPAGATCRRRQNVDRTRLIGTELEAEYRQRAWRVTLGYLYQASWIVKAPGFEGIEGNDVPGLPRHQVVLNLRYAPPGWPALAARLRWVGSRFEDDRNTLELGSALVVDLSASAPLGRAGEIFVAVSNLFDEPVEVGKTTDGIVTTGTPRVVRAGLRVRF